VRTYQRAAMAFSVFALVLLSPLNPSKVHAADPCISVKLHNNSPWAHTYTIKVARRCDCIGNMQWNTPIAAHGTQSIWICSSHTVHNPEGYGEFWYHADGVNTWTHATLLHDGEDYNM